MEGVDISLYISELLYRHDCVIIPGFGGFVAHYAPAKIHPVNHSFLPPSKNLLFNSKLIRDDGLLIDHISQKQNITYGQAKALVEDFTRDLLHKLSAGEVARFKSIGNLQRDSLGKLLFDPDDSVNYLEESFGLPGFVSPPIRRQTGQKRMEKRFIDRKPSSAAETRNRKRKWAYAALVPVLLLLGWFVFFGNFKFNNTQQTAILPIQDTELNHAASSNPDQTNANMVNPPLESLDFSDAEPVERKNIPEETAEQEIPPLVVKKYFIIGGAFGVEQNAEKFLAVLRKKGYAAERAGISPSGLHMVSYYSTEDKSEALVNLEIIRQKDNPSAWLIRK